MSAAADDNLQFSSDRTASFLQSIGVRTAPPKNTQVTTVDKSVTVTFVTPLDVLVVRLARHLTSASSNSLRFSFRRYGYLIGQLPVEADPNTSKFTPMVATTRQTFQHRFLLCVTEGVYCVARTLALLKTNSDGKLAHLDLYDVAINFELMQVFSELVTLFRTEVRLDAGGKGVTRAQFQNFAARRLACIKTATACAASLKTTHEDSDAALQPVSITLDSDTDAMSKRERLTFEQLKNEPAMRPLHHLLRLCQDACKTNDAHTMVNAQHTVFEIPHDTPVDGLNEFLMGPLLHAISDALVTLTQLRKDLQTYEGKGSSHQFKGFGASITTALQWVLSKDIYIPLFAHLVEAKYNLDFVIAGGGALNQLVLEKLTLDYNMLLGYFVREMHSGVDVRSWLQQAMHGKKFRVV